MLVLGVIRVATRRVFELSDSPTASIRNQRETYGRANRASQPPWEAQSYAAGAGIQNSDNPAKGGANRERQTMAATSDRPGAHRAGSKRV